MSSIMHQKIAEVGMAANQAPGAIDWDIIPDDSVFDNRMEEDPRLDDWVEVPEDYLDSEGQTTDQKAMQHARLQTIIACIFFLCFGVSLITF
jgi:hypothetical protein